MKTFPIMSRALLPGIRPFVQMIWTWLKEKQNNVLTNLSVSLSSLVPSRFLMILRKSAGKSWHTFKLWIWFHTTARTMEFRFLRESYFPNNMKNQPLILLKFNSWKGKLLYKISIRAVSNNLKWRYPEFGLLCVALMILFLVLPIHIQLPSCKDLQWTEILSPLDSCQSKELIRKSHLTFDQPCQLQS